MKGKVIKTSKSSGIFVQVDKNSQICDLYEYDRSLPKDERIRSRIRGWIYDKYKGQPLYSAWNNIVEDVTDEGNS